MKRIFLFLTVSLVMLSLTACVMGEVIEFSHDGATYYYGQEGGIKTVTNHHPYKPRQLPDYQEMVQWGDGAGLENDGVVYYLYAVDTTVDAESPKAYYSAELDGTTKQLLCEEGEYFATEADKAVFVDRMLYLIDIACPQ